jgi:hypothetical protein
MSEAEINAWNHDYLPRLKLRISYEVPDDLAYTVELVRNTIGHSEQFNDSDITPLVDTLVVIVCCRASQKTIRNIRRRLLFCEMPYRLLVRSQN